MFKPVVIRGSAKQIKLLKQFSQSSSESHRIVERAKLLLYIINADNVSNLTWTMD